MKPIVFIDRDGTIIREPKDQQIDTLEKLEFIPGIITGLQMLTAAGYSLVMVSNQDGLGTQHYPKQAFTLVQKKILTLLAGEGIRFEKIFICPHKSGDGCSCRKPNIGLLTSYLKTITLDRGRSFVFGDRETDVEMAQRLGIQSVRLTKQTGSRATYTTASALDACLYMTRSSRTASDERMTTETRIRASVALDGTGKAVIHTGIGFFDHMLEQLARHSQIDIELHVDGDLHIDEHHTVEDTGIILGTVIHKALGAKVGIERFAAPLDEALTRVTLDLSGRSYLAFDCTFRREYVGEFPTELVEDFFRSFTDGLHATLHISCSGRNEHHKIESMFKAVARALRSAIRRDLHTGASVPSTKGVL